MNKAVYEKPEFDFNDLFLFDGVAETCWGYHEGDLTITIYKDKDHDNVHEAGEDEVASYKIAATGSSCNDVYKSLYAQLKKATSQYDQAFMESEAVTKENSKALVGNTLYVPIS